MRKVVFANNQVYHVFNRGIEKRPTFTDKREFIRALTAIDFYRYKNHSLKLSKVLRLETKEREKFWQKLKKEGKKLAEVLCYNFLPNHFHFLLRQKEEKGISKFLSDFTNSYTRYFNIKHKKRIGPIFQGNFSAVRIEDENQLLHVIRYICINPAVSFLVKKEDLENYPWSSLVEFLGKENRGISETKEVLSYFPSIKSFKEFLYEQIDYGRELEKIKHLILE